jgi:chromosomal replication initiation ATPase DnaA
MRDWIDIGEGRRSMRSIAAGVAELHGLRTADLYLPVRHKWVTHPRQEAMARMSYAGFSHHQIVHHFGLKNHTTSIHARHQFEERGPHYRVPLTLWTVKAVKQADRTSVVRGAA